MANYDTTQLFGGGRASQDKNTQRLAESLIATTSRKARGPRLDGGYSLDFRVDSSAGVTSVTGVTVWYSNLPDPDETTDTDWVQDTTIGTAIVLTATGTLFLSVTGKRAAWVRVKCDVTAGTAGVRAWYRADGVEVR